MSTPLDAPRLVAHRPTVAAYLFDGMSAFELGCVTEVFALPRPELDVPWYEFKACAQTQRPLRALGGFSVAAEHGMDEFAASETVIVTAVPDVRGEIPSGLITALRAAYERGARIVSICSGAFALAEAGLLDGLGATTHWRYADVFRRRFPKVRLDPDVLYVDEGQVLTGAGSAAGLDLCLHLIRLDHGAAVANAVARRLVLPPHRDGGQAQFIEPVVRTRAGGDGIARSLDWALDNLARPITVAELARVANLSDRSYLRHFARATGTSPLRWLVHQRLAAARELLETGDTSIEQVGAAVGFADPATFRHHFTRAVGTSPSAYRRTFRG
ncbi:helix-turn-helix domain-containing protein [Actinospica sp. MGRD01-02]|uniref:Helix-turn-helix domain-containing protein n=1 Tax=Actinospica acidithermotolerans TaxID=2828514 RepID=A0A941E531_9ACTN|nr:helix-turn-helix domain-containing protein [Actinospica acidithermotolerans]MBR7825271.1 helix-turn-helix domain-containing protein [Actinospica acidithermotolerans]